MRLIDADALLKALKANCDTLCNDKNTNWCEHCCPKNDFEDLIDDAQTIDTTFKEVVAYECGQKSVERPQGEWLTHRVAFHLTCPFCGCNLRALKDKVFEGDYEYNFCPNCGADMRGGRE